MVIESKSRFQERCEKRKSKYFELIKKDKELLEEIDKLYRERDKLREQIELLEEVIINSKE